MSRSACGDSPGELVEREPEMTRISRLLDAATGGRGGVLLLEGPAGIGKTALLRWVRATAASRGSTVLAARATELEQEFAYGVVRQLFEPCVVGATPDRAAAILEGPAALVRPLLLPEPSAGGNPVPQSTMSLLHGLYWVTANLSGDRELLIAVDDVQWADLPSARFLQYLVPRVDNLPIAVLLGMRSGEPILPVLRGLPLEEGVEVVRLKPLSPAASGRLVELALGEADPRFTRACHEATEGNPYLLRELLRSASEVGLTPAEGSLRAIAGMAPKKVAASVLLRLSRLPPEALQLAKAVAVAGSAVDLRVAVKVSGVPELRAAEAADSLSRIGILRTGRPLDFVHPIVRTAVYAEIPSAEKGGGHRTMARLLASDGAPLEQVASHLLHTEPAGDGWTVDVLRRAGREALEQGAPESSVSYLRRALAEAPGASEQRRVLFELGFAEKRIEPSEALKHLSEAYSLTHDSRERAVVCRELLAAYLSVGRAADAAEVVRSSIAGLPAGDELAVRLEAEFVVALRQGVAASPLATKSLERWRGRTRADSPAERLMLSQVAVYAALSGGDAAEVSDLALQALGGSKFLFENSPESLVAYVPVYPLICADRFAEAAEYLQTASVEARLVGSPVALAISSVFQSILALALGNLREAEAYSSTATDTILRFNWEFLLPAVGPHIDVLMERGDLTSAEALLSKGRLDRVVPETVPGRLLLASRGMLRIRQGRYDEGLSDLFGLMEREQQHGPSNLYLTPYRPWAALALSATGRSAEGHELMEAEVRAARRWGAPRILGLALRMAGLVFSGDRALKFLQESVAVLEVSQARLAYAQALADLGGTLRRAGRRSEAVPYLRKGMDLAYHCGSVGLAGQARDELKLLGTRPRARPLTGVDSLTAGERRVADMAAEGLTNRQIAQSLFLSTRTVELHLTHVYQKLGITSRQDLAPLLC